MADPKQWAPLAIVAVGVAFVWLGVLEMQSHLAFRRRALRCRGVVAGFRARTSDGSTLYHPILVFELADGREVRTEGPIGKSWRGFRTGQEVTVTYDPIDPLRAYPGDGGAGAGMPVVFMVLGATGVTVGLAMLVANGLVTALLGLL